MVNAVDDDFFAMLAVRQVEAPAPPLMHAAHTGRIESAKAALLTAKNAVVHCDGGCDPNPGNGGWGVAIDADGQPTIPLWGGEASTTNNRMEMTAAIVALSVLPTRCKAVLISDSQYLVNGMNAWLAGWKRKGYMRGNNEIPNADLWRTLNKLNAGLDVRWEWVRGHNGHTGNEQADGLASRGMREARGAS